MPKTQYIYIEFVGVGDFYIFLFPIPWTGIEAKKFPKQTSFDVFHQDQGVVQPPKRQKLETNASSEVWPGNGP